MVMVADKLSEAEENSKEHEKDLLWTLRSRYLGEEITELISQKTPKGVVQNRKGRGGDYNYVPVYDFTERANTLFGFLWSVEVDREEVFEEVLDIEDVPEGMSRVDYERAKIKGTIPTKKVKMPTQVWVRGSVVVHIPGKTVVEKIVDSKTGEITKIVETRIDPVNIRKSGYGGTDIKTYQNSSEIIDIGDDFKSAEADMLKKCLSYVGFFSDVYKEREIQQETGPSETQLRILKKKAVYMGGSLDEKLEKMCQAEFQTSLKDLDLGQYNKLLRLVSQGSRGHAPPNGGSK